MFQKEITLFNYLYSEDDYSKTLIKNVEVQPVYRTFPDITDTQNLGSVLIIIPYKKDLGGVYVNEGNDKKYYLKPKIWAENTEYFTIQNNSDFIIVGNYFHLTDVNLNEIKNTIPDVFVINEVKDFADDLKHFEITAN